MARIEKTLDQLAEEAERALLSPVQSVESEGEKTVMKKTGDIVDGLERHYARRAARNSRGFRAFRVIPV